MQKFTNVLAEAHEAESTHGIMLAQLQLHRRSLRMAFTSRAEVWHGPTGHCSAVPLCAHRLQLWGQAPT